MSPQHMEPPFRVTLVSKSWNCDS